MMSRRRLASRLDQRAQGRECTDRRIRVLLEQSSKQVTKLKAGPGCSSASLARPCLLVIDPRLPDSIEAAATPAALHHIKCQ